jgi:hypothetical protein
MRASLLIAAATGILLSTAAQGQSPSVGERAATNADATRAAGTRSAGKLLGADVHDAGGSRIGEISDLVISGAQIVAVELALGGFLGIGERHVEVPYEELRIEGGSRISVARTESELLALSEPYAESQGIDEPVTRQTPRTGVEATSPEDRVPGGGGQASGGERSPVDPAPEVIEPLALDEELAEIDPRLAEGIAANEEAFDEEVDDESFDNDADR